MITLRQLYNHMLKCDPSSLDLPFVSNYDDVQDFGVEWYSEEDEEYFGETEKETALAEFDGEWSDMTPYEYAKQFKKVFRIKERDGVFSY